MKNQILTILTIGFISSFYSVQPARASGEEVASANTELNGNTLTLGAITSNPKKYFDRLHPLSQYLESKLDGSGIEQVSILLAPDLPTMQTYLNNGQVDVISESILTAIKLDNVDMSLLRWKSGMREYRPLLISHKDSGIESIHDLVGESIAFEDPKSTSAYLIPMLYFTEHGFDMLEKENIHQGNLPGHINYLFATEAYSTSEQNLAIWSSRQLVGVAAIANKDWVNIKKFPKHIRDDLHIIHEFEPIPRALTLLRSDLDSDVKQRLTQILIEAKDDPASFEALRAFKKTSQFSLLSTQERQMIEHIQHQYEALPKKQEAEHEN